MKTLITIICFIAFVSSVYAQYDGPESAVWDNANKRYYISNAGAGRITQWTYGSTRTFASGLIQPKAMVILDSTLYVCDYTTIKTYNTNTGVLLDDVTVPGATYMNDMCVDSIGNFYITETYDNSIIKYTRKTNTYSKLSLKGSIDKPNGIIHDGDRLIIVSFKLKAPIQAISLKDYTVTTIKTTEIDYMDGIQKDGKGNVYFSAWFSNTTGAGKVFKMKDDFTGDSSVAVSNLDGPADIVYNQLTDTLVIPCMNGSAVIFIGMPDPPSAPKLLAPANGTRIQASNILRWNRPRAAEKFNIEIANDSTFVTTLFTTELIDTSYTFKTDQQCDTIFWRIKAKNDAGVSPWSDIGFLSPIKSNLQTLVEPADNLTDAPLGIKFVWNKNNLNFKFMIDTLQDFSSATNIQVPSDTSIYYSALVGNKQYYWKVIGITCTEEESEVRTFTTANVSLPSVPQLLSPTKNQADVEPVLTAFQWEKCDNTNYYLLYVSLVYNYAELEALDSIPASGESVINHKLNDTLKPESLTFWKVEAHNKYGKSVSESRVFNTGKITSVPEDNYLVWLSPNPASDYIEIDISNVILSEAKNPIHIFDILGIEQFDTPPNPLFLEGGKYRLDVSALAPGGYFVRIGDFVGKFVKI